MKPFLIARDFLVTIWRLVKTLGDWWILNVSQGRERKGFAFLVHPRDFRDICVPFPFFRYLPERWVMNVLRYLPPITVSRITGVRSVVDGKPVPGWLLSITLAPSHFAQNPRLWRARVRQCVQLAEKKGAAVIGLGAWLPWTTRYGKGLTSFTHAAITTGHAFTAHVISQQILDAELRAGIDLTRETVAIVGAAGSTGSACARVLAADRRVRRMLLVDLERQNGSLARLKDELVGLNDQLVVEISTDVCSVRQAKFVVTATNSPNAIIGSRHLQRGAWVFDDSQPRNISPETLRERPDIRVIDVLAQLPGIDCHVDFGLVKEDPEITFACLVETAVLAAHGHRDHFSIGSVDVPHIREIARMAEVLGAKPSRPVSFGRPIDLPRRQEVAVVQHHRGAVREAVA